MCVTIIVSSTVVVRVSNTSTHQLDMFKHLCARQLLVTAAIFFHDAIYDPKRQDNEELRFVCVCRWMDGWVGRWVGEWVGGC